MAAAHEAIRGSLTSDVHTLLQPTAPLHESFLELAKRYLDPLAEEIATSQQRQLKVERQSRKRKRASPGDRTIESHGVLRLKKLHVEGFNVEQVWQQAQKIIDAAANELHDSVSEELGNDQGQVHEGSSAYPHSDELLDDDNLGEEGVDYEVEGNDAELDSDDDALSHHGEDSKETDSEIEDDRAMDSDTSVGNDEADGASAEDSDDNANPPADVLVKDKFGLNDGFFSIDQFNKQSEFLEHQDARGDPDDGMASDEEEIDWTNDPLMAGASIGASKSRKPSSANVDNDEDEDEDDGPRFGDADLDAPDTDEDENDDIAGDDDDHDMFGIANDFTNTNDIHYKDFFAPPAQQRGKTERRKRNKPQKPDSVNGSALQTGEFRDDNETQMQRAMADVERDLLEDDESNPESDPEEEAEDSRKTHQSLSSHEKRMGAFRDEIRRLEHENLANREWALLGETVAPARPENALLEEDLDFERAGKPVPIATEEVNESIEDLIKRRILANDFDELTKRRPDLQSLGGGSRGMTKEEVSDVKASRGLAEEYEDEYLRENDPNYVDKRSEATKKAQAVIAAQWADISAQLDALSNYHYKPRPPETNLEIRTEAPVIQMEEARPTAGMDVNMSGLAPQEVYKPGQNGRTAGEIMTKGGTAIANEEDTRESRRRRRRREKARARLAGSNKAAQANGNVKGDTDATKPPKRASKHDVVKSLKKGNVKVIGKKGDLQDVEGKAASMDAGPRAQAADWML